MPSRSDQSAAPTPLLSAREAQAILGVGRTFLTVHAAELGAVKVGGRLKFTRESLSSYVERRRVTAPVVAEDRQPTPIREPNGPAWLARAIASGETNPVTRQRYAEARP